MRGRRGDFFAAAVLAIAINLSLSVPASAAGNAPRTGIAPKATKTALPPVMKGGHGNNTNSTSSATTPASASVASSLASGSPTPQENWNVQNPLPDSNPIFAIACPQATECVASGLDGIVETTDSGVHWNPVSTGGNLMNAITCADNDHCAAVGYGGVVFTTANASTTGTWSSSPLGSMGDVFYGISCPTTSFCAVVGQGGLIYSGAPPTLQSSVTANSLFAVSCASASACVAVGGNGQIVSFDGTSWTPQSAATPNALFGVSCPAATTICEAVGQGGVVVNTIAAPGGWTSSTTYDANVSLSAVSCHSGASCYIVGTDGNVYVRPTNFQLSSGPLASTGAHGALFGISCTSDTTCFAAGENGTVVETTDGATAWTQQTAIAANAFHRASCPTATVCFAVGTAGVIYGTTNGGSSWTAQTSGTAQNLNSIACLSTIVCYAVGDNGEVTKTTDGGATSWSAQTVALAPNFAAVSCTDTMHCYAIGSNAASYSTINGSTWLAQGTITANFATDISCPAAGTCYATINDSSNHPQIFKTTNGAMSWNFSFDMSQDPDSGFQSGMQINAISCPSATSCYAVGTQGMILATSDGGTTWRSDTPPLALQFTGVSCPSTSTCFASADNKTVSKTSNFGATWAVQYTGFPSTRAYNDVACASTTVCLAIGDNGVNATTTAGGGGAWNMLRPTGFTGGISSMSCFGSANCYAVSPVGDILYTHNSGGTWTDHTLGTTETPIAISCPGANTCYAAGWPGEIDKTIDGGTTWTPQANTFTGADRTLIGISCANATNCVVVGTDGIAMDTSDGTTWNVENPNNGGGPLFAVSCPTTAICVAVGPSGEILTRNAGAWTARSSGTTKSLHNVTCLSASTCYVVGASGTMLVTTNGGVTWSAQSSGTTFDLNGISCAQSGFCVADGNFGTALATVDGATWQSLSPLVVNNLRSVAFTDLNHVFLAGAGGLIDANRSIFPSCHSVAISPSVTSPQPLGTPVTLNASASGCADASPLFRFWIRDTSGTWNIVQDWSASSSYPWNTAAYPAGTYLIGVWVKDANSDFTYDAYAFGTFTLQEPACTSVNIASDVGSPQNPTATSAVHFTATPAGCPTPEFQWWVRDTAGNWAIAVPFGPGSANFTWNTSVLSEGTYQIGVWVKQAFSTASYEAFAFVTYTLTVAGAHCSVPSLLANVPSPQTVTTNVTFAASAMGCTNAQFRYWIRDFGGTWHIVQDWTAATTYQWNGSSGVPNTAAGTYLVGIWARAFGSTNTYDDFFFLTFTLTTSVNPACSLNVAPSTGSGANAGTTVTWTAFPSSACNATGAKFRWFVAPPGGNFAQVQDYSTATTFVWHQSTPGTYQVGAWILQAASAKPTTSYDAFAFTTFTLVNPNPPTPCTDVEVAPSPASPQLANNGNITLTATAHGCTSTQYRWWVRDLNANWSIVQDYPGNSTFNWGTNVAPGTYLLGVWVRSASSTTSYDAYSFITFTLTPNPAPQVCSSVNIAPDIASPQAPGTPVTFTATSAGCDHPIYEFFVEPPGGSFAVAQGFSPTNTFAWNTDGLSPGPWAIGVWVKQNGSSASYEAFAFITYQLAVG